MKTKNAAERVLCRTPTPGKKPTRISAWKYQLLRQAILKLVPRRGNGVLFAELPALVAAHLSAEDRGQLGSISWYTTVVKLNMEVQGELARVPGSKPQRLLRT